MFRYLSWLSSKNGRRFTYFCVGGAALGMFGTHIAARGPLLDKVIDVCQLYKYGKPRALPDKVNALIEEVLHDSKLKEEEKKKLKFFYIIGHEIFHFGGINSPWGAIIGIPFTFEDIKDIDFSQLRVQARETVDWIVDGQDLLEALTLSESAKKFALMRDIYSCNFSEILQNAAIGALCILIPAKFGKVINTSVNAFERLTLRQRNIRYLSYFAFGFLLYNLIKDPIRHLSDKKADRLAAETSPEYLSGGIEYYQKTLEKNKALQDMSRSTFWRQYDDNGSENYFILFPKLPISKRLEYLQEMKRESSVKEDKISE